ncbi:MAG: hypothetical protein L0211_11110 [Planctomycetaceae bacterium]|nr:hypothetical protein [Planctomycetaceae bacterium]
MRASLTALVAAFVCAATGCANFHMGKRGGCDCPSCSEPIGCSQPIGCSTGVSSAGPSGVASAGPSGVASAGPPAAANNPADVAPYYGPSAGAYGPAGGGYGMGGGYGGGYGRLGHFHGGMGGPVNVGMPGAVVAYPYYTISGPRDFLLDNPPSIGR